LNGRLRPSSREKGGSPLLTPTRDDRAEKILENYRRENKGCLNRNKKAKERKGGLAPPQAGGTREKKGGGIPPELPNCKGERTSWGKKKKEEDDRRRKGHSMTGGKET